MIEKDIKYIKNIIIYKNYLIIIKFFLTPLIIYLKILIIVKIN
jgi:hypothetical protein